MATNDSTTTYVYFIAAGASPIKIGVANDPIARLRGLQTVHYKRLHLLYTIQCENRARAFELEAAFHQWYASDRLRGEWFNLSPSAVWEDIELLRGLARSTSVRTHVDSSTLVQMGKTAETRRWNKAFNRSSDKLQAALDWLTAHPGNLDTPSRDLAGEISVSHMTVHKAQQILKEANRTEGNE